MLPVHMLQLLITSLAVTRCFPESDVSTPARSIHGEGAQGCWHMGTQA